MSPLKTGMLMARCAAWMKTEQALVRIARSVAWSGSLTTASLVTPHQGRSRSIDCSMLATPSGDTPTLQ